MKKIKTNTQRAVGILLQYTQMALSILIQLVYTPIMLSILGPNEYGIYNMASSTISYLSLLSLGFGATYLRWYSLFKKENDCNGISNLNGLYLIAFSGIGIITFIAGMVLVVNVQWFFNPSYTVSEVEIARVLMVLFTVNLSISFPASLFVSYITSQEKFIFQKIVNMGSTVLTPIFNILMLYLGKGSIGMVVSATIISISVTLLNIGYCFKRINMHVSFKNLEWGLLKDIFKFSIFIAMNQIIDQINWQTDKIILGKFVNGAAVAVYTIGANINSMFLSFSTAVSNVFLPKVNMIVSKNEDDMDNQLTRLFIKVGRLQWFILALILSGFIFFGKYFISVWAGDDYINSYYVALLLMCPAIIPLIQNLGIEIQRAKNKHQFRSIVYLAMAFVNVGISILLTPYWHELGAAFGTTVSLIIANGIIMNVYYLRLGINIIEFWKSIVKTFQGLLIPVVLGVLLMIYYQINTVVEFLAVVSIYTIVYVISTYLFGFNVEERDLVKKVFLKSKCNK